MLYIRWFLLLIVCLSVTSFAQQLSISDPYLILDADADDPLYTTYAAGMERSRLYGDKAYKMVYYEDNEPIYYYGDEAGRLYSIWMINKLVIDKVSKFYQKPKVIASFPDMAILEYQPFRGIVVQETFFVYSSKVALVNIVVENTTDKNHDVEVFPVLESSKNPLEIESYYAETNGYVCFHNESMERLISDLYSGFGYPEECLDYFTSSFKPYSYGAYKGGLPEFYNYIKTDFYEESRSNDSLNYRTNGEADFVAVHQKIKLKPGEKYTYRYFRGWQDKSEEQEQLISEIEDLKTIDLQPFVDRNISLFESIPRIELSPEDKMVYLGAFNLVRSCMLPPADNTVYNFYVFSRQPLWGWGHGHQVLHESLSMLAYAYLDPVSAQNSQRVYMEQQSDEGLIAYRHGPRGAQSYPHFSRAYNDTLPTTSAPFFSYINWEIYKVSKDRQFLEDAYTSGARYVEYLRKYRDADQDGLFEWGPYGIIENVRDWYNAVFQVSAERYLDVDKEDISDELECLDLSSMLIKEMRCLSSMAGELNKNREARKWEKLAEKTTELLNNEMWHDSSSFFYSINRDDHSFYFMSRDLKRKEIIGFLPMWANATSYQRSQDLMKSLLNKDEFWRQYGVPTLAANDEWYSPYVDYCCKWNGPVWLLWDYMIFEGLVNYAYYDQAIALADKMMLAVKIQLSNNHNFWESYSADNTVLDCPSNYIWDAIMAKLIIERERIKQKIEIN